MKQCLDCGQPHDRKTPAKRCLPCAEARDRRKRMEAHAVWLERGSQKTLVCLDCGNPHGRGPAAKRCPPCAEQRRRSVISQWGKDHPEKVREAVAGYRQRHPERSSSILRKAYKKYAKARPERLRAIRKRPENVAKRKAAFERDRLALAKKRREAYERDPTPRIVANTRWAEANPEKVRDTKRRSEQRRRARLRDTRSTGVTRAQWLAVCEPFTRDGVVWCTYCTNAPATAADHIIPIARGGLDVPENVTPVCQPCNSSKGAKLLSEWRGRRKAAA